MPESKNSSLNPSVQSGLNLEGEIQRRAFELYLQRGQQDGHALEDWLNAEQELRGTSTRTRSAVSSKVARIA